MAVWVDDTLPDQDEWADMSDAACRALIEIWAFCKRSRNDGVIKNHRLTDASKRAKGRVHEELVANGWIHPNGTGCASDDCPKGVAGVTIVHNFLRHQESAVNLAARIEAGRKKSQKANHVRWHVNGDRFDPTCWFCLHPDEEG
jgi:hypothetical protein